MIKVLILGSTGLLGSTLLKYFSKKNNFKCYGAIRKNPYSTKLRNISTKLRNIKNIKICKIDYKKKSDIITVFNQIKPNIIINCIGIINKFTQKNKISETIRINSILPHDLAEIVNLKKKRLIHFSTDCVFSGKKGNYIETDIADPQDVYGQSKLLGELNYPNTLTLRTSIVGHELQSKNGLLEWFLDQNKPVKGYKNAIFSGLTALEIAKVLDKFVIPNTDLEGLYQLSGKKISKYDLLDIIKKVYKKNIKININKNVKVNRSLNSNLFQQITGYKPKTWNKMIKEMFEFST